MIVERFRASAARFGRRQAAWQFLHLGLARLYVARFLHVLWLDQADQVTVAPQGMHGVVIRPLSVSELTRHAEDPRLDMTFDFIRGALDHGHVCLGAFVDHVLAAYVWYGRRGMELFADLVVTAGDDAAYAYKGFTLPEFRERHCLAANLRHALHEEVLPGTRRLVSLVDASNLVSRIACDKIGFRHAGWLCVAGRPPLRHCLFLGGVRREDRLEITTTGSAEG